MLVLLRVVLDSGQVLLRRQYEAAHHRNEHTSSGVDNLAVLGAEGGFGAVEEVAPDSVESREGMPPISGQIPIDMAKMTIWCADRARKAGRVTLHAGCSGLAWRVAAAYVCRSEDWPKRVEPLQRTL